MSTTTFENAKIGDKVWSPVYGWGIIMEIFPNLKYSLTIEFPDIIQNYSVNGVFHEMALNRQSLFWDEVEIIAPTQPLRTKLINGVEIPVFEFTPQVGEKFYAANVGLPEFFEEGYMSPKGCTYTQRMIERGLIYPFTEEGKQAAILHAKAMLNISSLDPVKEE